MDTEISEWSGWNLANAEFLDYSKEIVRVAGAFDTEKLPVSSVLTELRTVNATLVDFINESRKSDSTAKIAALDAKRDALFRALVAAADIVAGVNDDTGIFAQAAHLANILGAYKGLPSHSLAKETQEIDGLQFDLEKTASVNALKETGLYKIAGQLFETNAAFKTAYSGRTDEQGEKKASRDGETTASLRKKAAALVVKIIGIVNAMNRIAPDEATASAADKIDAIVTQYKRVAASHGKKKPDDTPEPEENAQTA